MADEISKNTLLVLVVVTLIVSLVGSFIVMDSLTRESKFVVPSSEKL